MGERDHSRAAPFSAGPTAVDLHALLIDHVLEYAIFALDSEGRIRSWNAGAARLKGWTEDEILGAHFSRFYTDEDQRAGRPAWMLARATRDGRATDEGWRVRKDGTRFWADVSITALRDETGALLGFAKVTRDLTERRAAEERAIESARRLAAESVARRAAEEHVIELREVREQLEDQAQQLEEQAVELEHQVDEAHALTERLELLASALQATSESVFITTAALDEHGPKVAYANPAAIRLTGKPESEVIGAPVRALLGMPDEHRSSSAARAWLRGGRDSAGRVAAHIAGVGDRVLDFRTAPIADERGATQHFVIVLSDVTERVRVEEQLRQAQKMEALGQLAGGIAHDFNNVLTVIGANCLFLAQATRADDPRASDIAEIRAAAERAAGLTRQLLAFSRHQPVTPRHLDVNDVVDAAEQLLRRVLGENIELVTRKAPDLPAVLADRGLLEQVLLNLAVNARDAMPDGGRLEITTARTSGGVALDVRDTGHGMDEATQARIFEPFFTTKEIGKGTGLGLATVYGIVGKLGGEIAVESAPGRGATFTIRLPASDPDAAPAPDDAATHATTRRRHELVLLAEDDAALRRVARRALHGAGYHVVEATDGVDALRIAESLPNVDALATDVVMPHMRGSALATRLRERFPSLRVLYMSGYTADVAVERERAEPGTGFLEKPYDGDALVAALDALFDD